MRIIPDILIAAPNVAIAHALEDAVRNAGVECSLRMAETMVAFTRELDATRPDAVFTTWHMPGVDADTVLEMCRARDSDIGVIVVGDEFDEKAAAEIVQAGAQDILTLPRLVRMGFVMRHARADATEREIVRIAQDGLREKESLCRAFFDQDIAGIFVFRPDRTIRFVNPRFAQMMGYGIDEVAGLDFAPFVVENMHAETIEAFDQVASGRLRSLQMHTRVVTKSGGEVDLFGQLTMSSYLGEPAVVGIALDVTTLNRAEEALRQNERRRRRSMGDTVQAIASTLEVRDPYTAGHQHEVARLAVAIARELGVPEADREGVFLAASVHDIGKIAIPGEILNKPGPLTTAELAQIRAHPRAGYEILRHVDFPWPVAQMVLQHHERLDGSGYPAGLKDGDIILGARIIAVADVVQSMSMARSYRGPVGIPGALAEIKSGKGKLYDPACVEACVKLFLDKDYKFA